MRKKKTETTVEVPEGVLCTKPDCWYYKNLKTAKSIFKCCLVCRHFAGFDMYRKA